MILLEMFMLPLALLGYSKSRTLSKLGGRRFQKEVWIPPLVTTSTTPMSDDINLYGEPIPVLYTNDPVVAQTWAERHFMGSRPATIGWDVESAQSLPWRKSRYEGPATIQMSVVDAALVLQIAQEGSGPYFDTVPFLKDVLTDPMILKAGVGLDQDMIELLRWPEQQGDNCLRSVLGKDDIVGRFDIGGIGRKSKSTQSLKSLAKIICGVDLPKERRLSMSNWATAPQLSIEQIAYAARDAWVSAAVIKELSQRNPEQFSTEAILERIRTEERSIHELDERAMVRRKAKRQMRSLRGEKSEGTDRKDWTSEQKETVLELEQILKDMAPPQPILFDLAGLGF